MRISLGLVAGPKSPTYLVGVTSIVLSSEGLMRSFVLRLTAATVIAAACWGLSGAAMATQLTVLYDFCYFRNCSDGSHPTGGVIRDKRGDLYGTTSQGGGRSVGTIFELSSTGVETVLHSFLGGSDGSGPQGGLLKDSTGNLYG